jgi:hypothetical protein
VHLREETAASAPGPDPIDAVYGILSLPGGSNATVDELRGPTEPA